MRCSVQAMVRNERCTGSWCCSRIELMRIRSVTDGLVASSIVYVVLAVLDEVHRGRDPCVSARACV